MGPRSEGDAWRVTSSTQLDVSYHGVARRCTLELSVSSVVLAEEESEYEMVGESGAREGPSLGALRIHKVAEVMRAEAEARDALQTAEAETRAANLAKAKADDEARCVPHTGPHTTAFAW